MTGRDIGTLVFTWSDCQPQISVQAQGKRRREQEEHEFHQYLHI